MIQTNYQQTKCPNPAHEGQVSIRTPYHLNLMLPNNADAMMYLR